MILIFTIHHIINPYVWKKSKMPYKKPIFEFTFNEYQKQSYLMVPHLKKRAFRSRLFYFILFCVWEGYKTV